MEIIKLNESHMKLLCGCGCKFWLNQDSPHCPDCHQEVIVGKGIKYFLFLLQLPGDENFYISNCGIAQDVMTIGMIFLRHASMADFDISGFAIKEVSAEAYWNAWYQVKKQVRRGRSLRKDDQQPN